MRNNRKNNSQTFCYTTIAFTIILAIVFFIACLCLSGILAYNALIEFGNSFKYGAELVGKFHATGFYSDALRDSMYISLFRGLIFISTSGICIWATKWLWQFLKGSTEDIKEVYHFVRVKLSQK